MIIAKNNIISKINNSTPIQYAILNPISGCFDLMDESEYEILKNLVDNQISDTNRLSKFHTQHNFSNVNFIYYLLERGYAYKDDEAKKAAMEIAYSDFQNEIKNSQVQLMLVPTYGCNLTCTYCFQHGIEGRPALISKETVDAFFDYARDNFSDKPQKPFITLFGGEPLVNSSNQYEIIEYIIDKCIHGSYELSVVTNGYNLIEYIDMLKRVRIKEIQITLDGSRSVHDSRRAAANKKGTFDRIISGLEAAINAGMPINLRSVVDAENIEDIVVLAEFLNHRGWLDLPPELFKTQLGRNYELFECYSKPQHLLSQAELWGEYAALSRQFPILSKFHRPDFKGIRHLVDTGELYMASFDTCPACKTEWVFDLYGHIYGCTASCGREEYLLGTYWPAVDLNHTAIKTWQKRDVTTISKCSSCKYDVICGGGCGVVAANKNNGEILSPDCRPIQELLDIGINHYYTDILSSLDEPASCCCCESVKYTPDTNKTTPAPDKFTEGCIFCGTELSYTPDKIIQASCGVCGKVFDANVTCKSGHFICDTCHSSDILEKVEQLILNTDIKNPVELVQKIFDLPNLNMHGPEYHSITPAVLVAAYQNYSGIVDPLKIKEAIRRGKDIKGGSCGFNGSCGAGIGAGIAASIIENATPMSIEPRGKANMVTAHSLMNIANYDGPRCCKRDVMLSIESFIKNSGYFDGMVYTSYNCKQYSRNKDCIGNRCPYFPK